MTYKEAEAAILSLVRAMGEGDLIEGLGKLQMLQALDNMRGDWLTVLAANLPDEEPPQEAVNSPKPADAKNRGPDDCTPLCSAI